jgi:acyl-CoA synthetase (AMP-forming)/AMP-acid ligase II
MLTVADMLSAQARLQPDRIGARDLTRAMTFSEWNTRACQLANALTALGLTKGDRVAVLAYNRVEWAEIYAAVAKAGLIAVPLNFRLMADDIRFIVEDCAVAAVIAEDVLAHHFDGLRPVLPLADDRYVLIGGADRSGWQDYEALISGAATSEPGVQVTPADPWCLMYTSGTTGKPKGAIRSHRGMAMLALMTQVELGLGRDDDAFLVMPMCHANSLNFFTAFLAIGACTTIFNRASFDADLCLRRMADMGVTFTSLVPTHYIMMLERWESGGIDVDFTRIKKLMVSSAPARAETKRKIMEMFPNSGLYELYGSTEAGWVTFLHPDEQFDHLGSVGREVTGSAAIRLLDDDGREVPDGQPGELFSCSPYAFEGYWNLPEKTAEAFRDGYLTVGDVALRDAQGFIRLVDRKKNMIISGGENLYAAEVETVLARHPDIRDVAVVGLPDAKWGEHVGAAVVLRPGATLGSGPLIAWSRDHLPGFKRPRTVLFTDELPRNPTGKIMHHLVKEMFAAHDKGEPK